MVIVDSVSKSYDEPVLKNLSFNVEDGEVLGILGSNGAGKTTLLKILAAYHFPDSGSVTIDGFSVINDSTKVKSICGYLSENAPLYEYMKIEEFIYFQLAAMGTEKKNIPQEVDRLIGLCKLGQSRRAIISRLSSGYRQRCAIAGALAGNLSLLILDEPGKGLDPKQIIELREIIRETCNNITIIISSHILSEVELLCDRVLILDNGELKNVEATSEIFYSAVIEGEREIVESIGEDHKFSLILIEELKPSVFKIKLKISRDLHEESGGAVFFDCIKKKDLRLYSLEHHKNTLEETFMRVIGEFDE